jgi:hypothetical protein
MQLFGAPVRSFAASPESVNPSCRTSQFSRAFRARFGVPPRRYLALVRQQDLDWHEARLIADGFERDAFLWRQQGLRKSAASGTWHAPIRAAKHSDGPD